MSILQSQVDYVLQPKPLSMAVSYNLETIRKSDSAKLALSASENTAPESQREDRSLEESLFDNRAALKIITSMYGASHIDPVLRSQLFFQIDWLLKSDEWAEGDNFAGAESFKTLIKFILNSNPFESPGLGLSDGGNLLASWVKDANKLVLECLPGDHFKWFASCVFDSKKERAGGESPSLERLLNCLQTYQSAGWFKPKWQR